MPSSVGQSVTRVDALAKVKGEALYPGDFNRPGQLIMKVLFSDKVHAIVKSIDYSAAQQIPGIVAILTARDVPVNEYGLGVFDQAVLCGPGSSKTYADRVRCLSDQIALIIGETDEAVEKARKLIKVEYEDLPVQVDMLAAMHDSVNLIHPELDSNIFTHFRIRKGDVQDGFARRM
jgi:CO/xanthine dehydrogenase Mo-binding subunit